MQNSRGKAYSTTDRNYPYRVMIDGKVLHNRNGFVRKFRTLGAAVRVIEKIVYQGGRA